MQVYIKQLIAYSVVRKIKIYSDIRPGHKMYMKKIQKGFTVNIILISALFSVVIFMINYDRSDKKINGSKKQSASSSGSLKQSHNDISRKSIVLPIRLLKDNLSLREITDTVSIRETSVE